MSNLFKEILKESIKKKSLYRILTNHAFSGKTFGGKIIDIGGTKERGSHYRFINIREGSRITTLDINESAKPDIVLNIESDRIPREDSSVDFVFAFNVIEHLEDPSNLLRESYRILREGGSLVGVIPFLVNVHPDPYDFARYTDEKLEKMFKDAGFQVVEIQPIGWGPFVAGYSHQESVYPRILRIVILPFMFLLDWIVRTVKPKIDFKSRFPLAYTFVIKK